jgi:hypothetical protein
MLLTPCTEASWGHRQRCCRTQSVPKAHMNLLRRAACVPGIKTRPRMPSNALVLGVVGLVLGVVGLRWC